MIMFKFGDIFQAKSCTDLIAYIRILVIMTVGSKHFILFFMDLMTF